jgi:hypothetical protein
VRDLYELLLQKEALENRLQQHDQHDQHEIVRKANRSPSLRLRFGRRADPLLTVRLCACGAGELYLDAVRIQRIAQSVKRLATSRMAEGSDFESPYG